MRRAMRLAVLMLVVAPLAASGDSAPQVVLAQPGLGDGAIERFTMRFSSAMVPLGDPRAAAPFATACAGEGRWVDERSWVFDFAAPLPGGTVCRFEARQGLRDVAGAELGGQRIFTVDAGGPVARAVMPFADGDPIEEDQVFLVAANLPPTRESVAANAYCAIDGIGERVPVDLLGADVPSKLLSELGVDRWPTSRFIEQVGLPGALPKNAAERTRALAGVVALKCRRPLPPGRDVALVWGAGVSAAGGRRAGADQRFDYTVRKPFTARFECSRTNPQAGCNPIQKAWVRFSAPVPTAEAAKVRLTFGDVSREPVLSDEQKRAGTIEEIPFAGPLPFAQAGRVDMPEGLKDESGRPLSNAARFPLDVRTDAAPPLVKFAAGFGILESKVGGVLPVTVRNVEPALQGKRLGVGGRALRVDGSDGEIARWLGTVDRADDDETATKRRGKETVEVNMTGSRSILPAGTGEPLSVPLPGKGREFEVVGIPLKENGFYVVELASPVLGEALLGRRAPRYVATAALVTNMAVHFKWGRERSLAWVTSLDTGKPVPGSEVRVTDSCTGRMLARGVTDRSGGLMIPAGLPQPETYGSCEGGGGSHPLMVSARASGDMSFTLTSWGDGIRPDDFELPYGYSVAGEMMHSVFDRALVRQGEVIHMKHLLRRPVGAGFAVPADVTGTLKLTHGGSGTVFDVPLTIRSGSGESEWRVPAGAPMGDYSVSLEAGERTIESVQSFRVDEYKLPTMRASVTGPASVAKPGSLPIDLFVGYLSGGGASNLAVDLRVGWSMRSESNVDWPGYSFGGAPITEGVTPLDAGNEAPETELPPMQLNPTTLGADGAKRTSLDIPDLPVAADMRVEMDYRDANGEVLTASRTIAVLPSAVQIGVSGDGWLMKEDDLRLKMVALDLQGKPIKGQGLSVALYSREILTARRRLIGGFYAYDNRMRTTKLDADCSATTDAQGLARCTIDAGVSGEVYAVVTTEDADGRTARTTRSLWLAGDDDWWFGGDNGDRMDVVPERTSYAAGETARFQVRMPFREATALVTVEREGVLASYVTTLSGRDPVVEVKLPASYAPDVFVSVMAVRGRVESGFWSWVRGIGRSLGLVSTPPEGQAPTALVDLAKPAYRLGIAKVKVGEEGHKLRVSVKADRDRFAPRGVAQVQIAVRRPDGNAARSADVAFVAVDEALLQLASNPSWDVLEAMMGERPLSVLTATAQMQVVGKRHYGRKAVEAGGDGGGDSSALNRENFQPVLLWRGRVPLDAQGRARVAVPLSDALSSFKLVAIATEGAGLFGTGQTAVRTAQDLTIYAGLPPLVREGDRFAGAFTLRNGSARAMTVTARVTLAPGIANGRPLTVTIPAGGAAPVAWNLTAPAGIGALRWQVSATSADRRAVDRVSVSQDVIPAVPVETWAASLLRVGDASQLMIAPPTGALPGRGSVEVALTDSLAPSLAGARAYMTGYPYQCFEQRLSRIVVMGDRAGWDRLAGEMPTYQAADGLLRYFPGESLEGSESLTAYVLSLTSEAGLPIPAANRARMIDGLRAVLDGRLRRENYGDVRVQRVAALSALARAGAATPAMLGQIGMPVNEMPTSTLADYLVALDRIPGLANAPALRRAGESVLRSRLVYEGTRLDLVDQDQAAWWMMQSGDEAALKAVLATIGRPGWDAEVPRMMIGATLRQSRGHWDTTTANAWGAVTARTFGRVYPAQAVAGTTTLSLAQANATRAWPLAAEARNVSLPLVRAPLVLRQGGGAGPWATVTVRAAVPLRQPLFAGYRLSRTVTPVQVRNAGRLTRGDVVRVTLTVDATAERNWVVIDDPVPAGGAVVGDLGGQSAMLGEGGASEGAAPAYVERARGNWRGYFAWLPRGRTVVSYSLRLNGSGRFVLPPTRVEAMYSPAIRAAVPNTAVEVGLR